MIHTVYVKIAAGPLLITDKYFFADLDEATNFVKLATDASGVMSVELFSRPACTAALAAEHLNETIKEI